MRVAVVNLTGGGFSGGYRKYLDQLVPLLRQDPRVSGLEVYGPHTTRHDLAPLAPHVVFIPTARWANFGGPPVVPMVRNMEPLTIPFGGNSPIEGLKNLARARLARVACRRGQRIIAVSGCVRDFLVDRWRIDEAKIGVVEHGVEMPVTSERAPRPAGFPVDLAPGFLFTAGSLRPARGLEDVLRALEILRHRGRRPILVVAGLSTPGNRGYERRMRNLARDCGIDGQVLWAGQLPWPDMSWCYRNCRSFLMTSRVEACPNVLLEAMAHGCVCISVERPPMTAMLGAGALYYAVGNRAALAERLVESSNMTDAARSILAHSALQRARSFDWARSAERTITELQLANQ